MTPPRGFPALSDLGLVAPPERNGPAVLHYDIETAPALTWVWSQWQTNVIATEQDWYMLSFAYWWDGSPVKTLDFVSIRQDPDFFPDTDNDLHVVERLGALFDAADIIVAHHGDRFDRRKANARFLFHGYGPPSPYLTVDTKKVAAREFANYSNALKEIGRRHDLGNKTPHHGFELWRDCMRGDLKAWRLMERYNRQDVRLLARAYKLLLPYMGLPGKPAHPNFGHWTESDGDMVCTKCGSDNLKKNGHHYTAVTRFQTYQCRVCGGFSRSRKGERLPTGGVV